MAKRGNHEGSIYKRSNGKYRAQITLDGRRLSFCGTSRMECTTWLRQMQDRVDQGLSYEASQLNVEAFLDHYIATTRQSLRPKVAHQYERIIINHILPPLGATKLLDLRAQQIDKLYQDRMTAGIGNRTVRLIHAVLHRALEKAVQMGYLLRNPVDGATPPRLVSKEMMVLDEDQALQFLIAAQPSRNQALFHLAVKTGMRQGEILGLRWRDLNWTTGILQVRRQLQRVPHQGFMFCEPKTKSGRRMVQLGAGTLQALREHYARQQTEKLLAGSLWQENDLIFPSTIGTPLDLRNLLRDFKEVLRRASLPAIRFHDLRHTAASIMLNRNIPVLTVSRMLGHAKPSITLDVYGHLIPGAQLEAARAMEEALTLTPVHFEQGAEAVAVNPKMIQTG